MTNYLTELSYHIEAIRLEYHKQVRNDTFNLRTFDFLENEIFKLIKEVDNIKWSFHTIIPKLKYKRQLQDIYIDMYYYYYIDRK